MIFRQTFVLQQLSKKYNVMCCRNCWCYFIFIHTGNKKTKTHMIQASINVVCLYGNTVHGKQNTLGLIKGQKHLCHVWCLLMWYWYSRHLLTKCFHGENLIGLRKHVLFLFFPLRCGDDKDLELIFTDFYCCSRIPFGRCRCLAGIITWILSLYLEI